MLDYSHLNALEMRLVSEKGRLQDAKNLAEKQAREIIVAGIEKEIKGERHFLGLDKPGNIDTDQLLKELGV